MTRITKITPDPPPYQPSSSTAPSNTTTIPPRPSSPSGSFYAMSDDEEGDYDTVTHTQTGRGVKLLFSKSKVGLSHQLQLRHSN